MVFRPVVAMDLEQFQIFSASHARSASEPVQDLLDVPLKWVRPSSRIFHPGVNHSLREDFRFILIKLLLVERLRIRV